MSKRYVAIVLALVLVLNSVFLSTVYGGATDALMFDENNNLFFTTTGKKASGATRYKTIGFTVSSEKDNTKKVVLKLDYYDRIELDNGYIESTFTVDKDTVFERISKVSQEWADDLYTNGGKVILDGIFTIIENYDDEQGGLTNKGDSSWGEVYDTLSGIKGARSWAKPEDFNNSFGIPVYFPANPEMVETGNVEVSCTIDLPNEVEENTTVDGMFRFNIDSTDELAAYEIYDVKNATINGDLSQNISGTMFAGSVPISVDVASENFTVEISIRARDVNGIEGSAKDTHYINVTGEEIPPEPMPEKPEVDEPYVDIDIVPQDDDSSTPSNQIYEGESIKFEGEVEGGSKPRWKVDKGNSTEKDYGIISPSMEFVIEEPSDDTYAYQRVSYVDYEYNSETNAYEEKSAYLTDTEDFIVKQIQAPVVDVSGDIDEMQFNVIRIGQPYNIETVSYDINEPSEQHPTFDVVNEKWQIIDKETNDVVIEGEGLLNDSEFVFSKANFKAKRYYIFRTIAYNEFKPIRRTEHDIELYIENQLPQVNVYITSEDGVEPTFAKELFHVYIEAFDVDGYIASTEVNTQESPELTFIKATDLTALNQETYKGYHTYISQSDLLFESTIKATDDVGDSTSVVLRENIVKPSLYPKITVVDENAIQKKVYRFIEFDFSESYENAPFGIDFTKNLVEYQLDGGDWITISHAQNFEDENIHIHYPDYPDKQHMELFAKNEGNYSFSLQIMDFKGFTSDKETKVLDILPDDAPVLNYNLESLQRRITEEDLTNSTVDSLAITAENIDKGFIKINDNSLSPDGDILKLKVFYMKYDKLNNGPEDDIEYKTTIVQSASGQDSANEIIVPAEQDNYLYVTDINNLHLTFLTKEQGLGNYYIKASVREAITQLPLMSSPLHDILISHEIIQADDSYSEVTIENLKPRITFEVGENKVVNIIIHFDDHVDVATNQKINDLIKDLESKGFTVNLIKYENRY